LMPEIPFIVSLRASKHTNAFVAAAVAGVIDD